MPSAAARARARARGVLGPVRRGAVQVRNRLSERGFAAALDAAALDPGAAAGGAVAVFFATGPENLYQFEQWRRPLEALARTRPVLVVVDRPDTGRALQRSTALPLVFARSSGALERLVAERDLRVVLYLNQVEPNFRMLRFAAPVHVQIGHGESDKASSVSNQHKAYDLTFVGGEAGRDRLGAALRGFDAPTRTRLVGRPQLDHDYPGAPNWPAGSGRRIWYAPTWEGDRPSIGYGSLASHGVALVEALLAADDVRVIYRPHPRTGTVSAAHSAADHRIRTLLAAAADRHLVDAGPYGWQWRFADACVTDVSAVAYDWLATGKPLLLTRPAEPGAYLPPSPLLDALPLLPAGEASTVLSRLTALSEDAALRERLAGLSQYYFGDVADGRSSERFAAAVEEAWRMGGPAGR